MHNCEEFRERITEHIIDRENLVDGTEFSDELLICSSCSEFYAESREMIEVLSSIDLSISDAQWNRIEHRLRATIINAADVKPGSSVPQPRTVRRAYAKTPIWVAAAALVLLTVGLARVSSPVRGFEGVAVAEAPVIYVDQTVPLDPVTVDFLEDSELLLRSVMKISAADIEDVADAKKAANEQLSGIKLRKEAAADVPPVVDIMDTYETILRDLRNLDDRNVSEDIPDIQKRIQDNALIANIKAFQPTLTQISYGSR